jgi:hypothetical protein
VDLPILYFVFTLPVVAGWFVGQFWAKAQSPDLNLRWMNVDNRNMYVDAVKTMITASGIAVALLASSAVASARTTNGIAAFSAKVAVVCLISCVCFSLAAIMALLRGYELAQARYMEEERAAGRHVNVDVRQGALTNGELLCILVPSWFAFSCFLMGFVFLGRIAFHF